VGYINDQSQTWPKLSGGGATRPLPWDGGVEELYGDPNSRATSQVLGQRSKMKEVKLRMWDSPEVVGWIV